MVLLNLFLTDWLQRNIFYVVVAIILLFFIFILSCLIVKFYLDKVKETKEDNKNEEKEEKIQENTKLRKASKNDAALSHLIMLASLISSTLSSESCPRSVCPFWAFPSSTPS